MYALIRPLLFSMDPETVHHLTLQSLKLMEAMKLGSFMGRKVFNPCKVMGIEFDNPLGLSAGLDKNGDYIDALAMLGFGFIEVGTVTPRPQTGNPKPRLFRLPGEEAIINRMGFNNKGVDHLVEQLAKTRFNGKLGINIGKNKDTPNEQAMDDYLHCMEKVYPYADYIAVNLSSPNTQGLRHLQFGDALRQLLEALKQNQARLTEIHGKSVPVAIKVAPDLTAEEVHDIARALLAFDIEGLIATNTTVTRPIDPDAAHAAEQGGLSGRPLFDLSTDTLRRFHDALEGKIPVIASGGVNSEETAVAKLQAGASLVQVYSGLVFEGPRLVGRINRYLKTA